jgi:hypothetical protein
VRSGCSLSGGSLSFGQYVSGQTADLDAVGQINYTNCVGDLKFELDGGTAASVTNRQMAAGAARLRYQLYRNSTRSAVWGNGHGRARRSPADPAERQGRRLRPHPGRAGRGGRHLHRHRQHHADLLRACLSAGLRSAPHLAAGGSC